MVPSMMMRALAMSALVAAANGHGAVSIPRPRNSLDAGDDKVGGSCYSSVNGGKNGQACFWFNNVRVAATRLPALTMYPCTRVPMYPCTHVGSNNCFELTVPALRDSGLLDRMRRVRRHAQQRRRYRRHDPQVPV